MGNKETLSFVGRLAASGIVVGIAYIVNANPHTQNYPLCFKSEDFKIPGVAENGNPREIEELADEADQNFYRVVAFMEGCNISSIQEAAGKLSFLRMYNYIKVSPHNFSREPSDIIFVGGEATYPDSGTSRWKISFSHRLFTDPQMSFADRSIYMIKSLRMFERVSQVTGSATDKTMIDRPKIEAEAWAEVLPIARQIEDQLKDPYLILMLDEFNELGSQEFINYWRSSTQDCSLGFYP